MHGAGKRQVAQGRSGQEVPDRRERRRRVCISRHNVLGKPPRRLLEGQEQEQRQREPRKSDYLQRRAPAKEFVDPAAQQKTDQEPERDIREQDAHRERATLRRKVIGDQRLRRRRRPGLADTHADAGKKQRDKTGRHAAQGGHHAPQRNGDGDNVTPVEPVGQPGLRKADGGVKQAERHATEQTKLCIRESEFLFDRFEQYREDRPIHPTANTDCDQESQNVVAITIGDDERLRAALRP